MERLTMLELHEIKEIVKSQFDKMVESGTIPVLEYKLKNGEHLVVDLSLNDKGICFSFDSNSLPVYFANTIEVIGENHYLLPLDEYFEHLDYYLQQIDLNISEGFILPNDLYEPAAQELVFKRTQIGANFVYKGTNNSAEFTTPANNPMADALLHNYLVEECNISDDEFYLTIQY